MSATLNIQIRCNMQRMGIQRITEFIDSRPVFMMLHGKSVIRFTNYSDLVERANPILVSINAFYIIERDVLAPMGLNLDMIGMYFPPQWNVSTAEITEFLGRDDDNLLVVPHGTDMMRDCQNNLTEYSDKIEIVEGPNIVGGGGPNSMTALIHSLIGAGARELVLFGADGCHTSTPNDQEYNTYIGGNEILARRLTKASLAGDVQLMNRLTGAYVEASRQLFGVRDRVLIMNCSPGSHFTCYKDVTYDELMDRYKP